MLNSINFGDEKNHLSDNNKNISYKWGEKIPMRDGIHLNGTIYRPNEAKPLPAILTITPYTSDRNHSRGYFFAQNGYVFVIVDCRGRGNSGGEFEPFVSDGNDEYDIIEWLAIQPWCNGSVAMWGGSYAGFEQWIALKAFPPHLETIVPIAPCYVSEEYPVDRNIFFSNEIQWLTFTSGLTNNVNIYQEQSFWIEKYREMYLNHLPYKELDRIVGNETSYFQRWVNHPIQDYYWDRMSLTKSDYDRISIPILTITGFYDGDQPGAIRYYREHMASSSNSCDQHYLIIGPWDHAGCFTGNNEFGGLKFGEACQLDMNELHKEWYDWVLKGRKKPKFLKKHVAYYLSGLEKWLYSDDLNRIHAKSIHLFLNSNDGFPNDIFHSGSLVDSPAFNSRNDNYIYNPLDTRPAELECQEIKNYITDQRYAVSMFGNGLIYHSAPFETDKVISGFPKLVVWIAMDVVDTDFLVTLYKIAPDGISIMLASDFMRARYRDSLREERLVPPGEIINYEFKKFPFISYKFEKWSRLRLVITSPNTIYLQKNYNSGGIVAEESGKDAHTAHISLYHDENYLSYLELPVRNAR